MAYIEYLYTCVFLLALVACNEILFIEARQLKPMKKQEYNSIADEKATGTKHDSQAINSNQIPVGYENDLKAPVTDRIPSVHYSAVDKKEILPPMIPNQNLGFGDSDAVYKDDFRPTTPGCPGVGHRLSDHKDDFQPKALGNDPADSHSAAGNTDDFRPTNPGHCPGVGHSLQNTNAEPNA